ncbi:MAG: DUF1636 domain-containing protein [Methylobacteriaceae bacterium]|nr:DUF1636 domain-containing protein [Methylobacteriaceae bacterium]
MSDETAPRTVMSVCVTCRRDGEAERVGERLFAALQAAGGPAVAVRPVQCLSVCKRACTVALSGPGRYTYLFGDLDPDRDVAALLEGARLHAEAEHGFLLWRERPEALRRGTVARVPPLGWSPADGRPPR